ncbi:MAG: hypothetical protein ACRENU_11670 [Gemmatimonadaceae bacterium]
MPAPHKFSRKLHEVIGDEAAEAMVDWMNTTDERFDRLDRGLAEFRQTVRADFAELRQEMNARFAQMDVRFAHIDVRFAQMEASAERRHANLMKWMLGFWVASLVTYIGALVAVAKVLG